MASFFSTFCTRLFGVGRFLKKDFPQHQSEVGMRIWVSLSPTPYRLNDSHHNCRKRQQSQSWVVLRPGFESLRWTVVGVYFTSENGMKTYMTVEKQELFCRQKDKILSVKLLEPVVVNLVLSHKWWQCGRTLSSLPSPTEQSLPLRT